MKSGLGKSLLIIILSLVAYTLLFPKDLGRDLYFKPLGVSTLEESSGSTSGAQSSFFILGSRFGSFNQEGKVDFSAPLLPEMSVTDKFYSWHDAAAGGVKIQGLGSSTGWIPQRTYSYWIDDRLFILDENRMGIAEHLPDGTFRWKKEYGTFITGVDAGLNLTLVGLADGRVEAYDKAGRTKLEYTPGGSRIPVVFNLALSQGESHMAIVSGLDPKRFVLLSKSRDEYRPVFHRVLSDTARTASAVGFLGQGEWAYFADQEKLILVNTQSFEERTVSASGSLDSSWRVEKPNLIALLSTKNNRTTLEYLTDRGKRAAGFSVPGLGNFIVEKGGKLFLGSEGRMLTYGRVME